MLPCRNWAMSVRITVQRPALMFIGLRSISLLIYFICRFIILSGHGISKDKAGDTLKIIKRLAQKLGISLESSDINYCHRLDGGRSMLIKFHDVAFTSKFLSVDRSVCKKLDIFIKVHHILHITVSARIIRARINQIRPKKSACVSLFGWVYY